MNVLRSKRLRRWLLALAVLGMLLSCANFVYRAEQIRGGYFGDFRLFWSQARLFLHSGEIYPHALEKYSGGAHVYKFPPLYASVLVPEAWLYARLGIDPERVFGVRWLLQISMYLATLGMCVLMALGTGRELRTAYNRRIPAGSAGDADERGRLTAALWIAGLCVAILGLNYESFFENLYGLQVETAQLLWITLCLFCFSRGRQALAGIALGIAAMLKIYPVLLLVFFVIERKFRVVVWFAGTCVAALAFSVLILGADQCALYFFKILPYMMDAPALVSGEGAESENLAIVKYIWRLGLDAGPAKSLGSLIALALLGVTAGLVYRDRQRESRKLTQPLRFLVFVPLILLSLADSWTSYQLLLLLPIVWVVSHAFLVEWLPKASSYMVLAAFPPLMVDPNSGWVLSVFPIFANPYYDPMMDLRTLSTILIWAAMAWALTRGPQLSKVLR